MTTDLVTRLRELQGNWIDVDKHDFREAADLIESLQAENATLKQVTNAVLNMQNMSTAQLAEFRKSLESLK